MVELIYLPANEMWAFKFGNTLLHLYPSTGMAPLFFPTRESAIAVAVQCGLTVDDFGIVNAT